MDSRNCLHALPGAFWQVQQSRASSGEHVADLSDGERAMIFGAVPANAF